ncbi:hypothetical protein KDA_02170 [Dictyobacter alpinus]|uniref:Flippase-like domain-containing protein n=1 Tax=Dictyobacter alpinus TaxID=2014873 RepID=A0A402B060_9CHLR|nr:hypothetical protein KDA_02170 [Dictyobacter alpinus]
MPESDGETTELLPPIRPRKPYIARIKFALRLSCTVLLLAFLFKSFSWSSVLQKLEHLDDGGVVIGVIIGLIGVMLSSYQWQSLLEGEGITIDLKRLINLYLVGIAFNHFLPTGMGGDVVKAYYVGREGRNPSGSISAVVMSRVTGFIGMIIVSVPSLIIWHIAFPQWVVITYGLASLAMCSALFCVFFAVTLLPKFLKGNWARYRIVTSLLEIGMTLRESLRHPQALCAATIFGVLFHLSAALNYYAFAMILHIHIPLPFFLIIIPMVSLVSVLPTTINGYGLRESTFIAILTSLHVDPSSATALVLLTDTQGIFFAVIGGIMYLLMREKKIAGKPAP